jgi:hypothetical protein
MNAPAQPFAPFRQANARRADNGTDAASGKPYPPYSGGSSTGRRSSPSHSLDETNAFGQWK